MNEEMKRLLKEEQEQARTDEHLMSELLESKGWARLSELIDKYIRAREIEIVYHEMDKRDEDKQRGECTGMMLIRELPRILLEECQQVLTEEPEDETE